LRVKAFLHLAPGGAGGFDIRAFLLGGMQGASIADAAKIATRPVRGDLLPQFGDGQIGFFRNKRPYLVLHARPTRNGSDTSTNLSDGIR
jgi:hypothetical protein